MQYVGLDWPAYEKLSKEIGEGSGLKLTYKEGLLTIMPTSERHELIAGILQNLITFAGMALQKDIVSTGSATLRSKRRNFGVEPDLSYFVSKADIHQTKTTVEDEIDLAPDIVVEIDIDHQSDPSSGGSTVNGS
jgi:Uma2 family endonuclease